MIRKVGCLLAALLSCASAKAEIAASPHPYVRQVICPTGRGSAVRISRDRYLSVHHVTKMPGCAIDGIPVEVVSVEPELDFSILKAPPMDGAVKIDCGGFRVGAYYHSYGYAFGNPAQWHTPLYLIGFNGAFGLSVLTGPQGTIIPGMSGGGVFGVNGELVGMNNMYNPFWGHSLSRPLSETSLCRS